MAEDDNAHASCVSIGGVERLKRLFKISVNFKLAEELKKEVGNKVAGVVTNNPHKVIGCVHKA